jgi:hypothetical protein
MAKPCISELRSVFDELLARFDELPDDEAEIFLDALRQEISRLRKRPGRVMDAQVTMVAAAGVQTRG